MELSKFRQALPLTLFILSFPAAYLAVTFYGILSGNFTLETQINSFTFTKIIRDAILLSSVGFLLGRLFERRHTSNARIIIVSFTSVFMAYITLAISDVIFKDPNFSGYPLFIIFESHFTTYLAMFSAPSILTTLLAINLTRSISEKMEKIDKNDVFS